MTSWKLSFACTRAEAEAIDVEAVAELGLDSPPVLMTSERVADDAGNWLVEAYFEAKPGRETIAAVQRLVPGRRRRAAAVEEIADDDWVALSQAGIEPVHAGRFYVHTGHNRGSVPADVVAFRIDAGLAFGTGTHETTGGCLAMLDACKRRGLVVRNLLDLGTGTGLLAFAALHLWPSACATASDIDPRAIEVVRENAAINRVALGTAPGRLALAAAAGLDDSLLIARAPYDLIVANILAGPLIGLAPAIAAALAPGGTLLLAGLLAGQAGRVAAAYCREGLRLAERADRGDWPVLRLVKRPRPGAPRVTRRTREPVESPGFGSW